MQTSLKTKTETENSPIVSNSEFVTIKDRPKIVSLVEKIKKEKFGKLGHLSQLLAREIYKEIQQTGLYARQGTSPFQEGGKGEKFIPDTEFMKTLNSTFVLFRYLINDHGRKGRVVANLLGAYLGIKLLGDKKLKNFDYRKKLVMHVLQSDRMRVGLYVSSTPETINPRDFFDIQLDSRNRIKKIDINSYYLLVKALDKLQKSNKKDVLTINWCATTLRELEEFEASLDAQLLAVFQIPVNKRLSSLKKHKQNIYKRERTPLDS